MGFLDKWVRACDGRGPDVPRNGRDDLMIAKACLRHSHIITKDYPLSELRDRVAQQSGVYLTEEETEDLTQEVYDEMDRGKIPFWDVFNYRDD